MDYLKTNYSYPLIRTRMYLSVPWYGYQGLRNITLPVDFAQFLMETILLKNASIYVYIRERKTDLKEVFCLLAFSLSLLFLNEKTALRIFPKVAFWCYKTELFLKYCGVMW